MTCCVRPASARIVCAASPSSAGLPKMRPPAATIVSQPITSSSSPGLATARALRSAFSSATAAGSPSWSSGTSETLTLKSSPRRPRISRRCGEREARTTRGGGRTAGECAGGGET